MAGTSGSRTTPRWSPDGSQIAFSSARGEGIQQDIYLMDLAAGSVSFLVDGGASDHSPAWSPAGDRIAFFTSDNQGNSLWMVDVDGNGLELLTDGANDFDPV